MRKFRVFRLWGWVAACIGLAAPTLAAGPQESGNHAKAIDLTQQPKIVIDAIASVDWISNALSRSGYRADFSLESLKELDRFFDEQTTNGQPNPEGLLSEQLGLRLFAIGAYVGEVIRRQNGGVWLGDDEDPEAEFNISDRLENGTVLWPVQRVMARLKSGSEESIWIYGAHIAD